MTGLLIERALKPFALEAEQWEMMGDTRPIFSLPNVSTDGPTVGDLRRAAAALAALTAQEPMGMQQVCADNRALKAGCSLSEGACEA